jgi:hypothetical protein
MNEVFIAVPANVTLEMMGDVLRRKWSLDEDLAQPSVELETSKRGYVAEVDAKTIEDPLFFQPGERERLHQRIGDYRLFSLRYTSPALGRDMARAIATSELADMPMLLDHRDRFLTPSEFLAETASD